MSVTRNVLWNVGGTVWSAAVLFVMSPFLIHRIGVEDYGIYLLLASITGALGLLNLGLSEATLRFVAYYYSKDDLAGVSRVLTSTLFVYALLGTIAAVALFCGASWLNQWFKLGAHRVGLMPFLLRLTAVTFWLRFIAGPFFAVPQALLRYDVSTGITVAESLVRVAGQVGLVLKGGGLVALVAWNLVVGVVFLFMTGGVALAMVPGLRIVAIPSLDGLREVFGYGLYAFLAQLVGMIWRYADRVLLAAFVGVGAVAQFAVPQQLVLRVLGLASAAAAVLMPKFSACDKQSDLKSMYLHSTNVLLSVSVSIFVPLAVLMPDFLKLWVSSDFALVSGYVGTVLAASCLVRGAFMPYEALFRGLGKPQYYLVVVALASGTVLLADVALIPHVGIAGAAYAYAIAPVWGFGAIVFVWMRVFRCNDVRQLVAQVFGRMGVGACLLLLMIALRGALGPITCWTGLVGTGSAICALTVGSMVAYELLVAPRYGVIEYGRALLARAREALG